MPANRHSGVRLLILGLGVVLVLLQGRLWLSEKGWSEVLRLRSSVEQQTAENAVKAERNARLHAEVADLKEGFAALEERARADLGMVGEQESFYLLLRAQPETALTDD
jgi:cell division protein FtsB